MIECVICKTPMPELRLTQYGYKNCVECSTVGAYKSVTTTNGVGDHTWNGLEIMTPEQYDDYQKLNGEDDSDTHTITFGIENTKK